MQQQKRKVNVWDTYVTRKDGRLMHFDILAPTDVTDPQQIYDYGQAYLATKGQEGQALAAEQCRFCHVEQLQPAWEQDIASKGFFVIEMEGCE